MTTIRLRNLGAVAQTLIIPLYFRAMESRRPDSLIKDWKAVELVEQIDYDFAKAKRQSFDQVLTIEGARV